MNKCRQCLNTLDESVEVCLKCGFSIVEDIAETLAMFGVDKTQATEILSDKSMTPEKWQKIKGLFEAAQEVSADKREAFLRNACGSDGELKSEVEKLLGSFDDAESFMENPAVAEAVSLFADKETLVVNQTTGEIDDGKFVAGTVLVGRYRIIGLLGKGGMGEVFRAEDLKLKQEVALKFLPGKLEKNEAALNRFVGEVRTARQVSHPNVCKVFDIGETNGKHFLSMEFLDGDDLSSLLRRIGRLPSDKASEISRQICFGLHAIHDAGILHRDLKPANIIIDSKGKARITDFGIAGLEADILKEDVRVGTPAYMSPEQITGENVTAKSDIYSLGLLLYEIFTGKQAFQADSINDLIEKHKSETPTNPSTFVENIDPVVEKTINRCLEKNPDDRPKSALQVALALPGGNPLEVAIAAGETPSPEMVAAAPKKGALKPLVALSLLVGIIVTFGIFVFLNTQYKLYSIVPLEKSPEVLAERAKSIVGNLGFKDLPTDTVYKFEQDTNYLNYEKEHGFPSGTWDKLRKGQPLGIYFWYRQSSRYLEPSDYSFVTESDPPLAVSGMVNVKLDSLGRLVEFNAVPNQNEAAAQTAVTDWKLLFKEAGLGFAEFEETESLWTPPVHSNLRKAWKGSYEDFPDIPIRIEAASFNGKPVYFQIVAPWDKPLREQEENINVYWKAAGIVLIVAYILVIIGAIFLAWKNLKVGRGDLKGALKLAIFFFLVLFISQSVLSHHVPTINGELKVLYEITSYSLLRTFFIFLLYIALEPFVRRWWSELLISWNRLLAGDFRDPMIGRDILVGGLCGIGHTFAIYLGSFLRDALTGKNLTISDDFLPEIFNGTADTFAILLFQMLGAISTGLIILFLLLLFYVIFRKKWLSILTVYVFVVSIIGLAFVLTQHWVFAFSAIILTTLVMFALTRFGLLAIIFFWLFFYLSWFLPTTFDTSRFYFFDSLLVILTVLVIAIYAFYISIAGQPIFGGKVLREIDD